MKHIRNLSIPFLLLLCILTLVSCSESNDPNAGDSKSKISTIQTSDYLVPKNSIIFNAAKDRLAGNSEITNVVQSSNGNIEVIRKDASVISDSSKFLLLECLRDCEKDKRYILYKKDSNDEPERLSNARYYSQNSESYFEFVDGEGSENSCPSSLIISYKGKRTSISTTGGCGWLKTPDGERCTLEICIPVKNVLFRWRANEFIVKYHEDPKEIFSDEPIINRYGKIDLTNDSIQQQYLAILADKDQNISFSDQYEAIGVDPENVNVSNIRSALDEKGIRTLILGEYNKVDKKCTVAIYKYSLNKTNKTGQNKYLAEFNDLHGYTCDTLKFGPSSQQIVVAIQQEAASVAHKLSVIDTKTGKISEISKLYQPF